MAKITADTAKCSNFFNSDIPKYEDKDDIVLIGFRQEVQGYIGLQFADVDTPIYIPTDPNKASHWDDEIKGLVKSFDESKDLKVLVDYFSTPRDLKFTKDIVTRPNGSRYVRHTPHFVISK